MVPAPGDTTGMAQNVRRLHRHHPAAEAGILPAHHISTAALRATTGTAASVCQAAIPAKVGQILRPEPKAGVSLPQAAVALILTGIMAAVTAEAQALIPRATVPHPAINVRV